MNDRITAPSLFDLPDDLEALCMAQMFMPERAGFLARPIPSDQTLKRMLTNSRRITQHAAALDPEVAPACTARHRKIKARVKICRFIRWTLPAQRASAEFTELAWVYAQQWLAELQWKKTPTALAVACTITSEQASLAGGQHAS